MDFDFIDRDELFNALEPNDTLKITKNEIGELTYYSIDNFLKNPLDTISVFRNWPAVKGKMYIPGERQNFSQMDLVPILKKYQTILPSLGFVNADPTRSASQGLILSKDMQVWKNSWMPHTDQGQSKTYMTRRVVCNIWLCNYVGGTAFYKYKGHYDNDSSIMSKSVSGGVPQAKLDKKTIVPWQNFEGDEDWELYHISPSTFNTLIIYEGKLFHGTYAEFDDRYRYALQTFMPFGT